MTNKVPNIRFKGFTDDWEKSSSGDFLRFSRNKSKIGVSGEIMKTNSVPKIRFKGFTDDWEQRKLGKWALQDLE